MDRKLKKILDILQQLNSNSNIVKKEDFDEQYENLKDLRILIIELDEILNNFDLFEKSKGDEIEKILFEFHRILTTFEWHFSEISDLNTKVLKGY